MRKIKTRAIKHAKRVKKMLTLSKRAHRRLHEPVDHYMAWVVISVITIIFTLLINGALTRFA